MADEATLAPSRLHEWIEAADYRSPEERAAAALCIAFSRLFPYSSMPLMWRLLGPLLRKSRDHYGLR